MSEALRDLLDKMREHPAFPELLKAVPSAEPQDFKPTNPAPAADQVHAWVYRSGRAHQQRAWVDFLTGQGIPSKGG